MLSLLANGDSKQRGHRQGDKIDPKERDEDNFDGGSKLFKIISQVKSPNRLCCALTRGKNRVVVFCQLVTIIGTAKTKQNKQEGGDGEGEGEGEGGEGCGGEKQRERQGYSGAGGGQGHGKLNGSFHHGHDLDTYHKTCILECFPLL